MDCSAREMRAFQFTLPPRSISTVVGRGDAHRPAGTADVAAADLGVGRTEGIVGARGLAAGARVGAQDVPRVDGVAVLHGAGSRANDTATVHREIAVHDRQHNGQLADQEATPLGVQEAIVLMCEAVQVGAAAA